MSVDDEEAEGEQEQQDQDFTEMAAYINKDGNSKWLALDFMITSKSNEAQVATAAFLTDYQGEKAERRKGRVLPTGYTGPELSSLDEKFQ